MQPLSALEQVQEHTQRPQLPHQARSRQKAGPQLSAEQRPQVTCVPEDTGHPGAPALERADSAEATQDAALQLLNLGLGPEAPSLPSPAKAAATPEPWQLEGAAGESNFATSVIRRGFCGVSHLVLVKQRISKLLSAMSNPLCRRMRICRLLSIGRCTCASAFCILAPIQQTRFCFVTKTAPCAIFNSCKIKRFVCVCTPGHAQSNSCAFD